MSDAAELMPHQHRYTVEDYYRMAEIGILKPDDKVELIDGVVIDRTSTGSKYSAAVKMLNRRLKKAVTDATIVAVLDPIRLDNFSEPVPDFALLKYRQDFYADEFPGPDEVLLIIEVAKRSLRFDRDIKLPLYARHGIPHIWLVDLIADEIWIYSQPQESGYKEKVKANLQQPVPLSGLSGAEIDLSTLF